MKRPKTMWVLIDRDNGNPRSKRYLWWFETRALAREHKAHQAAMPNAARLDGPYCYRLMYEGQM